MQNNLKIDTRDRFEIISLPSGQFDMRCAGKVAEEVEACRQNARSVILNCESSNGMDEDIFPYLAGWHEALYADACSFVLCACSATIKAQFAASELEDMLNLAPTLAEAIDIVSMEDVERELLGGE